MKIFATVRLLKNALRDTLGYLILIISHPVRYLHSGPRLKDIFGKIRRREPFALARFVDGEWYVMTGKRFVSIDNVTFPGGVLKIGRALERIIISREENFYLGVVFRPTRCCPPEMVKWFFDRVKQDREYLTDASIFVNANYKLFLELIKGVDEEVVLFANEHADVKNLPFPVKEFYKVPTEGILFYEEHEENFINDIHELAKKYNNTLFIACAGALAKVVAYEGWKTNKTNRYVDIGSALGEFLFGRKTRPYQDSNHPDPKAFKQPFDLSGPHLS